MVILCIWCKSYKDRPFQGTERWIKNIIDICWLCTTSPCVCVWSVCNMSDVSSVLLRSLWVGRGLLLYLPPLVVRDQHRPHHHDWSLHRPARGQQVSDTVHYTDVHIEGNRWVNSDSWFCGWWFPFDFDSVYHTHQYDNNNVTFMEVVQLYSQLMTKRQKA